MKTAEENNADLIVLLERVIAEVREYGAITAKWEIDAEDCGATPYRYRIDAVINRDVGVTVNFPFWKSMKANGDALAVLRDVVALEDEPHPNCRMHEECGAWQDDYRWRNTDAWARARSLVAEHTADEERE